MQCDVLASFVHILPTQTRIFGSIKAHSLFLTINELTKVQSIEKSFRGHKMIQFCAQIVFELFQLVLWSKNEIYMVQRSFGYGQKINR